MTLNTDLIEKESKKLYTRYLKDPRIPEELCAEIYLEFMKRMKAYRDKLTPVNGKKHIDGGLIGRICQRSVQSILKKNKKQEDKETILTSILGRNASQFWCTHKSKEETEFFSRIAAFLKIWARKKKNYPDYLHIFLLYHAFHISPEFVTALAPYTNCDPDRLAGEIDILKEELRELDRKTRSLGTNYFLMIKEQKKIGNLYFINHNTSDEEEKRIKKNRAKALQAIRELKFIPTWVQLERLTGMSERKARYAYQAITKAINESFKDDTYWGRE